MTRWQFSSTGNEVVEAFKDRVKGKTIIITGPGLGGIGAETAVSIAAGSPYLIILAGRTESKITPVISTISSTYPSVKVTFVPLDLASQASVCAAAATINSLVTKIDILINNGAIMACPYAKSIDGVEMQFATNHVGHFLLTNLLIGKLLKAEGPRVINVSSVAHVSGRIRFEDVNFEDGKVYHAWDAYAQSKSANILFSRALASRLKKHGGYSFSLNPGSITTGLQIHLYSMDKTVVADAIAQTAAAEAALGREWKMPEEKTMQQGCSTTLVAALDASIEKDSGAYLDDGDISANALPEYLTLPKNEEKLWRLSEELVREKFDW